MSHEIYELLSKHFGRRSHWEKLTTNWKSLRREFRKPFSNLLITLLSQNTSDLSALRAYENLKQFGLTTVDSIAKADPNTLGRAIAIAGLQRRRTKLLKRLVKYLKQHFDGDASKLCELSRKELKKIPGVGDKTADVFLSYVCERDEAIVDRNIKRVLIRLGLGKESSSYGELKKALEQLAPEGKRRRMHELLLMLGREICKSRNPRCTSCPIRNFCAHGRRFKCSHEIK